jgi:hypothetical protein
MKVRELIDQLSACDPEADVVVGYEGTEKFGVGSIEADWFGVSYETFGRGPGVTRYRIEQAGGPYPAPRAEEFSRSYSGVRSVRAVVVRAKE